MNIRGKTTLKAILTAYDDHLHRTCGLCEGTRRGYREYVRRFLGASLEGPRIDLRVLRAEQILAHIEGEARRLKPRTVKHIATSLRSFFRFLRTKGMATEALEHAVPSIPEWRLSALPRGLSEEDLERFLASLSTSTPRLQRDRAIILCLARLGLRAGEVADLELEDIDWRAGTVRIRRRKSRREAVLPLPPDVGRAIAAYLRDGRASSLPASPAPPGSAEARRRQAWAQLLRKVFEVEPLVCPRCGQEMKIVARIADHAVVDLILRHRSRKGMVSVFEENAGPRAPPGA